MANKILAGLDEVGRGCLAGPVISCALILKKNINKKILRDSKTISFKSRIKIAEYIKENSWYAIGSASVYEKENTICIKTFQQVKILKLTFF